MMMSHIVALEVIKALTGTTWGRQKEMLEATYKAVMRPTLEYCIVL